MKLGGRLALWVAFNLLAAHATQGKQQNNRWQPYPKKFRLHHGKPALGKKSTNAYR